MKAVLLALAVVFAGWLFLQKSYAGYQMRVAGLAPAAAHYAGISAPRTVCFVKGNHAQLKALLNRYVVIGGREYWVRRQKYPVLVPERIRVR